MFDTPLTASSSSARWRRVTWGETLHTLARRHDLSRNWIQKFEAGYIAGAESINPDIEVDVTYLTQVPDFSGFADPAKGKTAAQGMYDNGADIVYHAAGGSGAGLFEAAKSFSEESGSKVWAIGVDQDQYTTADEAVREYIMTSMLKRVDVAVYNAFMDAKKAAEPDSAY